MFFFLSIKFRFIGFETIMHIMKKNMHLYLKEENKKNLCYFLLKFNEQH